MQSSEPHLTKNPLGSHLVELQGFLQNTSVAVFFGGGLKGNLKGLEVIS